MIRNAEQMDREIRERMRGGEGRCSILHIFRQEELKGCCRLLARITIPPGASIGEHPHDNEEEIYYVISGSARVVDGGMERILGPGDAVRTGDGSTHSIANVGDTDLDFMAVILLYEIG